MAVSAGAMVTGTPLLAAQTEPVVANAGLRFGWSHSAPRKRWWYCWLDWDKQAIAEVL